MICPYCQARTKIKGEILNTNNSVGIPSKGSHVAHLCNTCFKILSITYVG